LSSEPSLVLDASALLAFIRGEPGSDAVQQALEQKAWMSTVNWSEILARLGPVFGSPEAAEASLWRQPALRTAVLLYPFDAACALEAARLRAPTAQHGLSLADRACLALGRITGLPVLTADRVWAEVEAGVEVRLIR
jgi:PIN domain nuclease of toxin-antitoxin system